MNASPTQLIDREAVRAVAGEAVAIRSEPPQPVMPEDVLDAAARFQQAFAAEALLTLELAALEMLALDESLASMAKDEICVTEPKATAHVILATDQLLHQLQDTYNRVLKLRNQSPDVRVRKMVDVMVDAARQLFDRVEARRQIALECEAENDIAAGQLRKFGSARAATAYLQRLQRR